MERLIPSGTSAAARAGWKPAALAEAFLAGGARFLQLRDKRAAGGPLLDDATALAAAAPSRISSRMLYFKFFRKTGR